MIVWSVKKWIYIYHGESCWWVWRWYLMIVSYEWPIRNEYKSTLQYTLSDLMCLTVWVKIKCTNPFVFIFIVLWLCWRGSSISPLVCSEVLFWKNKRKISNKLYMLLLLFSSCHLYAWFRWKMISLDGRW